jgi:hypothetical protein
MTRIITGAPVRGKDLFGREAELKKLWALIQHGHVLLTGPRCA